MLGLQLPDRSSFRFGRRSMIAENKEQLEELDQTDTEAKVAPHVPLPLVHHTSTKSLFDLFQAQDGSAYGTQTKKNEELITTPVSAGSKPVDLQKLPSSTDSIPPMDASEPDGKLSGTTSMPASISIVVPSVDAAGDHSTSSTPSSGFRDRDDGSGCSRKSSTSSIGTPPASHKAYFEAMATIAAPCNESGATEPPRVDVKPLSPPAGSAKSKPAPRYDKPLPPPPSSEHPFSASSVLSVMRAESLLKETPRLPMQVERDAPVIFRRQSHNRPSNKRSASESTVHTMKSTALKAKSSNSRPRSKRGARLGATMSQGGSHPRSQTLTNFGGVFDGSSQPAQARRMSIDGDSATTGLAAKVESTSLVKSTSEPPITISSSPVEKAVFEIMKRLDDPVDVLAMAAVNRAFRRTFKRYESQLVNQLLLRQCPAAWEFQKNNGQASGQQLSLREYMTDRDVLASIKSSLLTSGLSLSPETMAGLAGADVARNARVDNALWRIWTFCKGFGPRSLSAEDLAVQVDWLNGGRIARKRQIKTDIGRGNGEGLSATELEDLMEIWDSLGAVMSRFTKHIGEARAAGIFKRCAIDQVHTEEWYLEEWVYYVRSRGLPAVLLASTSSCFDQARESGLTEWIPPMFGQTRAGFFRAATASAYQERVLTEAATKAAQSALPPRSQHRKAGSDASISSLEQLTTALAKQAAQQEEELKVKTSPGQIRRKPMSPRATVESSKPNTAWLPESPDAQSTQSPDSKHSLGEESPQEAIYDAKRDSLRDGVSSPMRNSFVLQTLGMAPTASTRIGATLFPMDYPRISNRSSTLPSNDLSPRQRATPAPVYEPVEDPADKAMKLLTQDMGYSVADASRALATCDTGFGIDVQKAIEMLALETGRNLDGPGPATPSTLAERLAQTPSPGSPAKTNAPRNTCTGHQERGGSDNAFLESKPFEPLCDTYSVRQPGILGNINRNSLRGLTRMTSKAKAYKVLGVERVSKSDRYVSGEPDRPPRISSLKATQTGSERPLSQALPVGKRKATPRKTTTEITKLMGIDEEPSVKAMQLLGVDAIDIKDGRMSPAPAIVTAGKAKRRLFEGRFGNS